MPYQPWLNRKFGVEMEMRGVTTTGARLSGSEVNRALSGACTMTVQGTGDRYYHSNGTTWDVKSDASCGLEVASPALVMMADRHCAELRAGCRALAALTPRVDRTCGLHVHVDCSDFTWEELQRLVSLWARYEPFFYSMVPPSRRSNRYCQPLRRHSPEATDSGQWTATQQLLAASTEATVRSATARVARESGLNITGWFRHGRIEFRLHSGTVDYDKIRNWVTVLLAIAGRVKATNMPAIGRLSQSTSAQFTTVYVGKILGLIATPACPDVPAENAALIDWIEARRQQFDPANRPASGAAAPRARANF